MSVDPTDPKVKSSLGTKARYAAVSKLIAENKSRYIELLREERTKVGLAPEPTGKSGRGDIGTLSIEQIVARLNRWEPRIEKWKAELARREAETRARSGFDIDSTDQEQRAQVARRPG